MPLDDGDDEDARTGIDGDDATFADDVNDSQATTDASVRLPLGRPSAPIERGARYRLGKPIARGGMGEVISAHDTQIGRDVAIKRLLSDEPSSTALARFLREARIQGRLDHPAIVPVHELAYDPDGRPFFSMRKLSGTTLSKILRQPALREKFPRQRLLRAFADVCLAIEFAHTRGVVHRDLKPANIVLGDFGEVYVLDWGIARVMDAADLDTDDDGPRSEDGETAAGAALGTPGYMPPEQIRGERDLDGRADVYALGCLLFEILAGSPLHPRGESGLRSALDGVDARPSVRAGDRDIPPELDELSVRATTVDRDARLGSARELGEAVQRYLDGDRDLALRSRLANEHLAAARAALAAGGEEEHRRTAMREAGQALALDPTLLGAAELVGRLMLEPPPTMPRAVVTELAAIDERTSQNHARIAVGVHAVYLSIAAAFVVIGIRDPFYIGGLAAISVANLALAWAGTRSPITWRTVLSIAGNLVTLALFARMFTPFLIAPGVAAVVVMVFAFHPIAASTRALILLAIAGGAIVLGMWAIEATDLVSATMAVRDGKIFLASPIDNIAALPVEGALCAYVIVMLATAGVLAHSNARTARSARDRLHVQAWQLRQLISISPAARDGAR